MRAGRWVGCRDKLHLVTNVDELDDVGMHAEATKCEGFFEAQELALTVGVKTFDCAEAPHAGLVC